MQIGLLHDAITQLTSYHALQPVIKLSARTVRLLNTLLVGFSCNFLFVCTDTELSIHYLTVKEQVHANL